MAIGKTQSILWQMQQKARTEKLHCGGCGRLAEVMTVDHIIPDSFLQAVGLVDERYNDGENLQYLCRACNILKAGKFDFRNPKTLPLLRKYVAKIETLYQVPKETKV